MITNESVYYVVECGYYSDRYIALVTTNKKKASLAAENMNLAKNESNFAQLFEFKEDETKEKFGILWAVTVDDYYSSEISDWNIMKDNINVIDEWDYRNASEHVSEFVDGDIFVRAETVDMAMKIAYDILAQEKAKRLNIC